MKARGCAARGTTSAAALCAGTAGRRRRAPGLPEVPSARETRCPASRGSRGSAAPCVLQPEEDLAAQHRHADWATSRPSPSSPPPEAQSTYPAVQPPTSQRPLRFEAALKARGAPEERRAQPHPSPSACPALPGSIRHRHGAASLASGSQCAGDRRTKYGVGDYLIQA